VSTLDPGLAVKGIEAVVGAEQRPPVVLNPVPCR
jgi:hypothetical protein